jgi:hypothetical protein
MIHDNPTMSHLSSAWIIRAGVQNNSANHIVDAAVKVTPTPAAVRPRIAIFTVGSF